MCEKLEVVAFEKLPEMVRLPYGAETTPEVDSMVKLVVEAVVLKTLLPCLVKTILLKQ